MEEKQENKQMDVTELPLMKELVAYYNEEIPAEVIGFRLNHAAPELAYLWHKMKQEGKSAEEYYTDKSVGDLYLADLTKYQLMLEVNNLIDKMLEQIEEILKTKDHVKILEYGGGIANFSTRCKHRFGDRAEVFYYDLDGPIRDYAVWRIKGSKLDINIVDPKEDPLSYEFMKENTPGSWDIVNCMDVLEHIPSGDVGLVIENLGNTADNIFVNPAEIQFNAFFPQHITRYDVSPYFKKKGGYLWKNRKSQQEKDSSQEEPQSSE